MPDTAVNDNGKIIDNLNLTPCKNVVQTERRLYPLSQKFKLPKSISISSEEGKKGINY